ncbi:MAG: PepSY domain-containing protein [Sedimentisphaerales bacterium]|nr:PepSY domain-containing protein [Sedimentisphaerales bacterium]
MRPYQFCFELHKWLGIALSVVLINVSVTGVLLLVKKQHAWIQPPTRTGHEGAPAEFVSMQVVLEAVRDCNHPDFRGVESIDRVDFRPDKRVYKVTSKTNYAEIQVDAITADVLSASVRRSDWLEQLHDGSLLGAWMHGAVMPAVAVGNVVLTLSGLYLWLGRKVRRRKGE